MPRRHPGPVGAAGRAASALPRLRAAVCETALTPADFIYPLFVVHGENVRDPIPSMPGIRQLSVDRAVEEAGKAAAAECRRCCSSASPHRRIRSARRNFDDDGIVQRAIRAIKAALPDLLVVTDVCLCEYTDHGHCGVLNHENPVLPAGYVLNDETLDVLARVSVSHARAGADGRRPERHDRRHGRSHPRRARRPRLRPRPDHVLRRQVRLGVLRPVPGRRAGNAEVRRPAHPTRWTPAMRARRSGKPGSTSRKARIS